MGTLAVNKMKKLFAQLLLPLTLLSLLVLAPTYAKAQSFDCELQIFWTDPTDKKDYGVAPRLVAVNETWTVTGKFEGTDCLGKQGKVFLYNNQYSNPIQIGNVTNLTTNTSIQGSYKFTNAGNYTIKAIAFDSVSGGQILESSLATLTVDAKATTPPASGNTQPGSGNTQPGSGNTQPGSGNTQPGGTSATAPILNYDNPINAPNLPAFVIQATKILLLLIGMIVVVVIIYGGFMLITSQGNPERIKRGKAIITWAIIGLVVALLAFSIVSIFQSLLGK